MPSRACSSFLWWKIFEIQVESLPNQPLGEKKNFQNHVYKDIEAFVPLSINWSW